MPLFINLATAVESKETLQPLSSLTQHISDLKKGFDSVSRMSWIRNLPKTREFFLHELGGIELEGHTILGDGTTQNILPILTGQTEFDLPSARVDDPMAGVVDNFPWIWNDFEKAGYVTAYGEDMAHLGTFQMRLKGWKRQPVDHYMRPYFLRFGFHSDGPEPKHNFMLFFNYFRDMYHMYGAKRKFMFGFYSSMSHEDNNDLKLIDADFADFLRNLKTSGYLDHTILILMADHGARHASIRETQQGKLEERLPYFGLWFPPGFKSHYPAEVEQVWRNRKRMTTQFDIHETLSDLLDNRPSRATRSKGRGISLFKPIPETRTCEQAKVEPHWCPCLKWDNITHDEKLKASTAQTVVEFLNHLTEVARNKCEILSLDRVVSLSVFTPRKDVLKYMKSIDRHGDIADMSDTMSVIFEFFQIDLFTNPGQGRFQVTVKHSLSPDKLSVREQSISRINTYGNAPACVLHTFPNLRRFCQCKTGDG